MSALCRPLAGIVSRLMPMMAVASVNKNTLYPELQQEFDEDPLNFPGNVRARAAAGEAHTSVQMPISGAAVYFMACSLVLRSQSMSEAVQDM